MFNNSNKVLSLVFLSFLLVAVSSLQLRASNKHHDSADQDKVQMCQNGKHQSPINIISSKSKLKAPGNTLKLNYNDISGNLNFNGHTWQVTLSDAESRRSTASFRDPSSGQSFTYQLKQFHLHIPSEHQLNGEDFDLEFHFVHELAPNQHAAAHYPWKRLVIGILANKGNNPSSVLQKVHLNKSSTIKGFGKLVNGSSLIHYRGSLTTPPCTENVNWFVVENELVISSKIVEKAHKHIFEVLKEERNAREIQPLGNRKIWRVSH